jgi:DNA topoisomerase-1
MEPLVRSVVAKYKAKKKTESGNTVYIYGPRQVAERNKEKAQRIEAFRTNVEKLRKKVKSDLRSDEPDTKLTALAVALIDHTYERVGNDESAENGHYGVTGWTKKHVSFGRSNATIKYVGKSGVSHNKKVTDKSIISALRDAYEAVEGDDSCLFEYDGGCVDAKRVNAYLKDFDITAKDLRGFHANREMQEKLEEIRSKGGELPKDKKEREKLLKSEFKEALEHVAKAVGHEASTLKSQYLVPGLEESFMKDGTVIKKMTDKVSSYDRRSLMDRVLAAISDNENLSDRSS